MVFLFLPHLVGWPGTSVSVFWAVISTVFVYQDTRVHSLSAEFRDCNIRQLRFVSNLSPAIARDDNWHGGVDRDRRAANDPHRPAR